MVQGGTIMLTPSGGYIVKSSAFLKDWLEKRRLTGITAYAYQKEHLLDLPEEEVKKFFEWGWAEPLDEVSKGQLVAKSADAVGYWLNHFADILQWIAIAKGDVSPQMKKVKHAVALLDGENLNSSQKARKIALAFQKLRSKMDEGFRDEHAYPDVDIMQEGSRVLLSWKGFATEGRYITVDVDVLHRSVTVEWDTATGKESSFLALPSAARKYAIANSGAMLYRIEKNK